MTPNLPWLPMRVLAIMCLTFSLHAHDVQIINNGGVNTNGSFVGTTWTPTASPSILDYSNFIAMLNAGDVTITTNGVGSISFEEMAGINAFGYDFTGTHTLTLQAEGDVTITGWGIAPAMPVNTGKLNVVITVTADGDLEVSGQGIESNGGDISITGIDEAFVFENAFKADGASMIGNLSISGNELDFGIEADGSVTGGDIIANDITLTLADTIAAEQFSFQTHGAFSATTNLMSVMSGNFVRQGSTSAADDLFTIQADSLFGQSFQIDWDQTMTLDIAGNTCLERFNIRDERTDHSTDFFLNASYANLQYGEVQLRNGMGTRTIGLTLTEKLDMNGVTLNIEESDGEIYATAPDSIHMHGNIKGGGSFGTGSKMHILDGNGSIRVESGDYLHMQYSELSLREGDGTIDVKATNQIDWVTSQAQIDANPSNTTLTDAISVETKVLHFGYSEISIRENILKGDIKVIATDTFLAYDYQFPYYGSASGGFIGYGNYNQDFDDFDNTGFGDVTIESKWFHHRWLYLGNLMGEGNLNVVSENMKAMNSQYEVGAGSINIEATDSLNLQYGSFHVAEAAANNDITLKAGVTCLEGFMVIDTAMNHTTDILLEGDRGLFQNGEFNIRNGDGQRNITLNYSEIINFKGVSTTIDLGDGDISVTAQDSIIFNDIIEEKSSYGGSGGRIGLREGNGNVTLDSDYLQLQYSEVAIRLGSGIIDITGTNQIDCNNTNIMIIGADNGTQTAPDQLNMNTKVLHFGYAEASIARTDLPGEINITATDTLDAGNNTFENYGQANGGYIGFGGSYKSISINYNGDRNYNGITNLDETTAVADGDLNINAGWMTSRYLYLGQQGGSGNVNITATDTLTLNTSSIEHSGPEGDLSLNVGGALKISLAEIGRKDGVGALTATVNDSLLINLGGFLHNGEGPLSVETKSGAVINTAKIEHEGGSGDMTVKANHLNMKGDYNFQGDPNLFYYSTNNTGLAAIQSSTSTGNLLIEVAEAVELNEANLFLNTDDPASTFNLVAGILDMEEACVFIDGSEALLKVQVDDVDLNKADISVLNGTADLTIAGETLDMTEAKAETQGGNLALTFNQDITITEGHLRSNGGNMDLMSLEGAFNMATATDGSNTADDLDGIFTGATGVNGGELSIVACTGIDVAADINTGEGTGGNLSTTGTPISTDDSRETLGTGSVSLTISDDCTQIMSDISDPCSCEDPQNIVRAGQLLYFHEVVVIEGAPGDTWVLRELNAGTIFDETGTEITDLSSLTASTEPNGDMVNYIFEFWHEPDVGYDATFESISGLTIGQLQNIGNSCSAAPCVFPDEQEDLPAIPTFGLFLLGALLLGAGLFTFKRLKL